MNELLSPDEYILQHANLLPFIVDRTTVISPIQRFEPLMKVSFQLNNHQHIFMGFLSEVHVCKKYRNAIN